MRSLKTHLLLIMLSALSFIFIACLGGEAADDAEFQNALPTADSLTLAVPGGGSGALAVGDASDFYQFTRGISSGVNGHVIPLLSYLKLMTLFPPTERGDDYRVWGPSEPQGLENVSWRYRVDRIGDGEFRFTLDGRPKGETSEDAFKTVISGTVKPGSDPTKSTGTLTLDFTNDSALQNLDCRSGEVHIDWDSSSDARAVDVRWDEYINTCLGEDDHISDAVYHYTEASDRSGTFEFIVKNNIHADEDNKPMDETFTINSRWMSDGAGRSDVVISGGEISEDLQTLQTGAAEVKATQCWGELFTLTYADTAPDELEPFLYENVGAESDCVFKDAAFPQL